MNARLSASLAVLGTAVSALSAATDAETSRLASIEEQLRNSDGLSNDETNALADQISSITGSITESTTRLTNSLSDVHQAAGTSDGSQIAQGGLTGSGGASSGGITGEQAQFGNASTTQQGGSGQQEQGGEQPEQGGEQPQDPAPQTEG